ncbi:LytR/AlgR family response regulator transcription factor [Pseudoalteromonas sp. N1230-9]|uniref:LytR/AlgR family response regulator transcription factor n=1 Tax=Pseudoalteromonas sp. N1230-9 TaxID=2907156 RepID=UPI003132F120
MISTLIVDDEPLARARIKRLLAAHPQYDVIADAENGELAVKLCQQLQPDLVLLDINMPKCSGMDVAAVLKQLTIPPAVVFLTAHPEHALEAFELAVDGYLVKPVTADALSKTLSQLRRLNRAQVSKSDDLYISYQLAGVIKRVHIEDLICCTAEQKYTRLTFDGGEALVEQSLKQLELQYPAQLMRIHRNTLVNKNRIYSMAHDDGVHSLMLDGASTKFVISRREVKTVKAIMGK